MLDTQRLFVGNIPKGTSEDEIGAEFGAYGAVESIELKTKPNPLTDSVDTFGFVTLRADDRTILQCIKEFREQKYKGVYLNVSRAKESFLDRLKREREEAEAQKRSNGSLQNSNNIPTVNKSALESSKAVPTVPALPTLPTLNQQNVSSSDSSESESEEEDPSGSAKNDIVHTVASNNKATKEDSEVVKKWNQETYIEHGKLKIVPITGQVKEVIDRSKSHQLRAAETKKLGEKARIADEKRKQGLTNLKSTYDQQKNAIKIALSGETLSSKRKIIFNDGEDESPSSAKLSLFDAQEDEDNFEGNFKQRTHLQGEEGQKLYEMQTTYQADNRFRLDARFLDQSNSAKGERKARSNGNEKERLKQLEILSNVTGKPMMREKRMENKKTPQMQRFDPSHHERNVNNEPERGAPISEIKRAERPEFDFKVSEQKFYSVSGNLVSSIGASADTKADNGGFSLLSMFGRAVEDNQSDSESGREDPDVETHEEKPLKSDAKFKYESSDSEEESEKTEDHAEAVEMDDHPEENPTNEERSGNEDKSPNNTKQRKAGYYSRQGIWKENFFFLPNDIRLDDGRKFFGIVSNPDEVPAEGEAEQLVDAKEQSGRKDIRKIFKKRRQREGKSLRIKSKLGFRIMKKKTLKK